MGRRHRVLLYTLDDKSDVARAYLAERGLADQFDLVLETHESVGFPEAGLLDGVEALVGDMVPVDAGQAHLLASKGVRLYAAMSVGVNHLDLAALDREGVLASFCPGYCAEDVALHAFALMLDLMRQVTVSNRDVRAGLWDPYLHQEMHRPQGQVLGLVFLGSIARHLVPLARALGMDVVAWAPTKTAAEVAEEGATKVDTLDELLMRSDVVSLHCPLVPETEGLIGRRELALMKPTAFLVNTARGPVVDEEALVDALETGTIQGAALDVLADEREGHRNRRLIDNPRCVVTPHSGFATAESCEALMRMSMESVVEVLVEGREPTHACHAR